jgi:hypothetical protein
MTLKNFDPQLLDSRNIWYQWSTGACYLSLRWHHRKMRSRSELARALSLQFYHITCKQIAVIYTRETCRRLAVVYLGVVTEVDTLFHQIKQGENHGFMQLDEEKLGTFCPCHSVQISFQGKQLFSIDCSR